MQGLSDSSSCICQRKCWRTKFTSHTTILISSCFCISGLVGPLLRFLLGFALAEADVCRVESTDKAAL